MKGDLKTKLKKYRIGITRTRLAMLEIFLHSNEALTHGDFLNYPLFRFDRTTVFRTLNLFVERKVILRIPSANGVNRYLLQKTPPLFIQILYVATAKNNTTKNIGRPEIKLPKGFKKQNMEIMIGGLCDSCKSQQ